ncbi:hypothetical protein GE21DRAFT_5696 [Neurospora crassa]|uniref:N-acetyltransferase domain-containing protein n=1 Tax=Neurospora crassa (strain ATCC 24698 / 74-OR23-1A / CBS 708.71 / DSM 1257 / FGSC 987) TaxID=367110 RepID=Q7S8S1_NEUCR|nr:hypothetical protein NCU07718 [Neurospora crassa OR74A]EAA32732.3 hypothetical protein NCU07718 [Neurospora crassa OR74A]KHE79010.1 hypothetical protein GE21DRAFT_5696 [Neurospora crassa]|eukprot:XP_961968.3 hypothetical protein NCU07718 [Neurospora crassa OR74A]
METVTTSNSSIVTSDSTTISNTAATSSSAPAVTVVELKRYSLVPPKWQEFVRAAGMSECREVSLSLAHAFAADDYAQYLVNTEDSEDEKTAVGSGGGDSRGVMSSGTIMTPEAKWKLHVDIMTYAVAMHCLNGLVTTIGPEYDSVALWLPPGHDLDSWWVLFRSGAWRLYYQLSIEGRKRYFDEVVPLLHDTKAQVLGERDHDAWYLVYLGTKPSSQGRGYAGKLLKDVMQRADAENRPMYLESSSLANNSYYQKFGFETKRDIFLKRGRDPVRLSIMVREPNASGMTPSSTRKDPVAEGSNVGTLFAAAAAPLTTTTTTTSNTLLGSTRAKFPTVGSHHHHGLLAHGHYHVGLGVGGKKLM